LFFNSLGEGLVGIMRISRYSVHLLSTISEMD
jgi:hypothetical protein